MLTTLIQGSLTATPVRRMSSKDKPFATAQMRAAGEDGETIWCSVIAFDTSAVDAMLALKSGDAVAIAGLASLNHWQTTDGTHKVGLKVTAQRVLTVYDARRKRAQASAFQG